MKPIYLDYNATTPLHPQVLEVMLPWFKGRFGNPSSSHSWGAEAKRGVMRARAQVADLLGCHPDEIIFTSGGSESNNLAICGAAFSYAQKGKHIITSQVEHPAVMNVCKYLEGKGFRVIYLPVDKYGMVDPTSVEKALTKETILITIMHAQNEVGTIQPIEEIGEIAHRRGVLFHTDAAQSVGKIPTKVDDLRVDLLSIAGHKFYGPKGIGALYIRREVKLEPLIWGAEQEGGLRAGTENVPLIVGLGQACEIAARDLEENMAHLRGLRDKLWQGLSREIPELKLNGHPQRRLPNTLSVAFPGVDAQALLSGLDQVAASAGAACHTDVAEPSYVLVAMKVPTDQALGTVRFSVGRGNTEEEIERAIGHITQIVRGLRPQGERRPRGEEVRLTQLTHGLGCACKLRPQNLQALLRNVSLPSDPQVVVGAETLDDACVYRTPPGELLVESVDFFTPVVDDPYQFGAIAAANSLSDIYAMGAKPLFALSIVSFPEGRLPLTVLEEILQGAKDKAQEAGIAILGGHTIEDPEPKFGLVVTGSVPPGGIVTNAGAQVGDYLILTKPIGLGVTTTGMKKGIVDEDLAQRAISLMGQLNCAASEAMVEVGASACTDVTGFGLLGHLKELTQASGVEAEVWLDQVPILPGAWDLVAAGAIPGGTLANLKFLADWVEWEEEIPYAGRILLCDAQTSGGLIISVTPALKEELLKLLMERGVENATEIGRLRGKGEGRIRVKRRRDD